MRFSRLALTRYGRFTDFAIDLGAAPTDAPDLHVIYGPNEAGKSTVFAAIVDLLFGIDRRSPYNFLHPHNVMRIDAAVEVDGAAQSLARIKRDRNDLLGAGDRPLPADTLHTGLGRLTRDRYIDMFSLNETTLAAGGRKMSDAGGNFSELLYGASAGIAELSSRLGQLTAEADAIFNPRARVATELRTLRLRLEEIRKERAEIDVSARAYSRLTQELAKTRAAEDDAHGRLRALRLAAARLESRRAASPALARLIDVRAALAPLASLPEPPPGAAERIRRLQDATAALGEKQAANRRRLSDLATDRDNLPAPDPVLKVANRLETAHLVEMHGRVQSAIQDIPAREAERETLEATIAATLATLGLTDADQPRLSPERLEAIDRLLDDWTGLSGRLTAADEELRKAEADAAGARPTAPEAVAVLEAALATAEASDAPARLGRRRETVAEAGARRDAAFAALAPWTGDAAKLTALRTPAPEEVAAWSARRDAAERELARQTGRRQDRLERRNRAAEAAAEASAAATALDDIAFAALIAERDAAWAVHTERLDRETATAFAALLGQTDAAGAARLADAAAVAQLRTARLEQAAAKTALEESSLAVRSEKKKLTQLDVACAAAAAALDLPADIGLDRLATWLAKRQAALEAATLWAAETAGLAAVETEMTRLANALRQALASTEAPTPADAEIPGLVRLARSALEAARTAQTATQRLQERQAERDAAHAAADAWREAWTAATADGWLADAEPAAARARLQGYRSLEGDLRERDILVRRVRDMRRDADAFRAAVAEIGEALGEPLAADVDALNAVDGLRRRLAEARDTAKVRQRIATEIAKAEKTAADLKAEAAAHDHAVGEVVDFFSVSDLEAAAAAVQGAARRADLLAQQDRLEREILAAVDGAEDAAAAEADLAGQDAVKLAADAAAFQDDIAALEEEARQATAARSLAEAARAQVGADDKAAKLTQERQTVLAEIQDLAERYLKLKLGAMAAERALDAYRARHRTDMLERASRTFHTITRGSFRGLTTQADGAQETLIALRSDGAARLVDDAMSVGTRAQLYLALRVAGFFEYAKSAAPPPFVADDIIETFDDARAAETFRVLADMGAVGQVIYLTHHPHLTEIARDVVPGVILHELPDPVAGG